MNLITNKKMVERGIEQPVRNDNKIMFIKIEDFTSDFKGYGQNISLGGSCGGKSFDPINMVFDLLLNK